MKVIINADGKTCTTVNPYPKPNRDEFNSESHSFYLMFLKIWEQAQSERQTFEIENAIVEPIPIWNWGTIRGKTFDPGTTHEAEIVNGKAVIK